jgi:hypothetical protein
MNLQKLIFQLKQEAKGISAFGWPSDYQHLTAAASELERLQTENDRLRERNDQQVHLLVGLRAALASRDEHIKWMEEEIDRSRAGNGQVDRIKHNTTEAVRRLKQVLASLEDKP